MDLQADLWIAQQLSHHPVLLADVLNASRKRAIWSSMRGRVRLVLAVLFLSPVPFAFVAWVRQPSD